MNTTSSSRGRVQRKNERIEEIREREPEGLLFRFMVTPLIGDLRFGTGENSGIVYTWGIFYVFFLNFGIMATGLHEKAPSHYNSVFDRLSMRA